MHWLLGLKIKNQFYLFGGPQRYQLLVLPRIISLQCRIVYRSHTYCLVADYLIMIDKETLAIIAKAFDESN